MKETKTSFVLLVSVVALVQCLTEEKTDRLKKMHMECFDETKVSPELIIKLANGNWLVENTSLKRWILCLLKKYDLMSNEGVFKLDTALSLVPQRDKIMIEDFIDDCLPKTAGAPHEIAWNYTKCYHLKLRDRKNRNKNLHYLTLFY